MVLRPLCKVSLTLSVVGHGFSNFYRIINYYYYHYLLKFCHMVFLRHMIELRPDLPTFVSIIGKSLTDSSFLDCYQVKISLIRQMSQFDYGGL